MTRPQRRAAVGALVTAAMLLVTPVAEAGPADVQRELDRAVSERGLPGVLAEVRTGHARWQGTAGVADLTTGEARSPEHQYRIGSTTKTFVATVVLQLAAEHKLRLDDTVERWLPGLVHGNGHDGSVITVRQLLGHTSGIFNYLEDLAALLGKENFTPQGLVAVAMAHPPTFPPGQAWAYSNTNYILAGLVVERVTGRPMAEEITRRIARPLGLTGTYLPGERTIRGPHSRHYTKLTGDIQDITDMDTSLYWATGGMVSTASDLTRFFGALLAGRLLPPAQQRQMFAMIPTGDGWIPDTAYGLGISSLRLPCGVTVWGMGGALPGSWSFTYGSRDGRRMVALNTNGDWNDPIAAFTAVLRAEFC